MSEVFLSFRKNKTDFVSSKNESGKQPKLYEKKRLLSLCKKSIMYAGKLRMMF